MHLLLFLSGQSEPRGEMTNLYSRSWVGFPAAGCTWSGLGFYLFQEDLAINIESLAYFKSML